MEAEVCADGLRILADFDKPSFSGGGISAEEYEEKVGAFPGVPFEDESSKVFCWRLHKEKPEAVLVNFASESVANMNSMERERVQNIYGLLGGLGPFEAYQRAE